MPALWTNTMHIRHGGRKGGGMAWYTSSDVRYRGRLVRVTLRYGGFMSAMVLKGKPLRLSPKDESRLDRLIDRKDPRARDCPCGEG